MIDMKDLLVLQGQLFLLIAAGAFFRRRILDSAFQKGLTDVIIDLILPCNIIMSFQTGAGGEALLHSYSILIVSICIQIGCGVLAAVLFRGTGERRPVMQYGTIISNAGFLGTPVAEGIFGSEGVLLASVFLIPQRITMWTVGVSFFTHKTDKRAWLRLLTNPCILAVFFGAFLMISGLRLPAVLEDTVQALSNCNTGMSMFLIGMLMSNSKRRDFLDPMILRFSAIRLLLIPGLTLLGCRLFQVDTLAANVSVVLTSMPAAGTTAILASKYGGDTAFAAGCTAVSTILSLAAIPFWCSLL